MQRGWAELGQLGFEPGPDDRVGARKVQPVEHRSYVQTGAADQDRDDAARLALGDLGPGGPLVGRDRGAFGDV